MASSSDELRKAQTNETNESTDTTDTTDTNGDTVEEEEEEDVEDTEAEETEDDEDDEPKLKYARMTSHLGAVYRNGDATSTFLVAGDKMFVGTHNGNIHVLSLPSFQSIRVYHAHTASITSISVSSFPPPTNIRGRPEAVQRAASIAPRTPPRNPSISTTATQSPRTPQQQIVPNIPSNQIYIATSSIDGNVCVASLVDLKDVQLRNFARPVQTVALSPDYKNDRTYLSGGLTGNLVLTVGGQAGTRATSSTTGTAAATASGWLGTIGLGGNSGKDTVLHYGEGTVSTIKWSLSGKYVVWVNEHGIKIMRSNLHLESADSESAWKRIAHVDHPQEDGWDEMASVWKPRVEWIDEKSLETDDDDKARENASASAATAKLKQQSLKIRHRIEKLLVGWGGMIWIINVHPGGMGVGKHVGERSVGRAEIIKILRLDCIVSGLSLYTPTLLLALCYSREDDGKEEESPPKKGHKAKEPTASTGSEPRGGIRHRQNASPPEIRLIDLGSSEEVEVDTDDLTVSRFERLSAGDYHLGILPAVRAPPVVRTSRGTLEALSGMGSGMWNATINATALLSSAASIRSTGSGSHAGSGTTSATVRNRNGTSNQAAHPIAAAPGMKIFIQSPYDCILAAKRDLSDHLSWILEHQKYQQAWELIDEHPEVISSSPERLADIGPETPSRTEPSHDDFFDDSTSTADSAGKLINSAVEKEKRRIGELWIQQLINQGEWEKAGQICGKVLGTSTRWEHYVWTFAGANKFDEITPYIPTATVPHPLPATIYGVVLGHYIAHNRLRLRDLLDQWSPELFEVRSVTTALENLLKFRDVREDSVEDGQRGRDWRIIQESLGKLYIADGRPREALNCYMRLHDADAAMSLIKDHHLVDAVIDDVPALILLRVSEQQKKSASIEELEDATSEAIMLLVQEARHGLVLPDVVVSQLEEKELPLYLFFYLRSLWRGDGIEEQSHEVKERLIGESRSLVDGFADLAVRLFADYDRELLMDFLKVSISYAFENAAQVCESLDYIPELIHLYSKTGQPQRALFLIIDRLADVSHAISFAKSQNDPDLWEDLLNYSMDKPRFIRGLLEEVGTSIDPIRLVRRIPEGLEVEGLKEGLGRMIKEYELQYSISEGVARVLRGEVQEAQKALRRGQRKGIKFDVHRKGRGQLDLEASDIPPVTEEILEPGEKPNELEPKPGHCAGCVRPFEVQEMETLVGFACGHVWHLSHLLGYGKEEGEEVPDTGLDGDEGEDGSFGVQRSVGAKVTHARLLRDRIEGGCPVCREKAGEE